MPTFRFPKRGKTKSALDAWHKLTGKLGYVPKKNEYLSRHTQNSWQWEVKKRRNPAKKNQPGTVSRSKRAHKTARAAWGSIAKSTGLKPSQVRPAHTASSWRWVIKKRKKNPEMILVNKHSQRTMKPKGKANPSGVKGQIPGFVEEIRYNRGGKNKGKYFHRFKGKPKAFAMNDGSILIKPN